MNLTKTNWPSCWTPNADAVNGDPGGLVRADNLCIDNTGVLALIQGATQTGAAFSDYVSDIFSRTYGGTIYYWVSLNSSATQLFRVGPTFGGEVSMQIPDAGTSSARACFGAALGKTLICAGNLRVKDDPTGVGPLPLGLLTPTLLSGGSSGTVQAISSSALEPSGSVIVQQGTDFGSSGQAIVVTVDPTALQGIGVLTLGTLDTTNIGGEQSTNISTDIFQFLFSLNFPDPVPAVNILTIQVLLDPNPSDPTGYQNYYTYNVDTSVLANNLLYGPDVATQISFQRGQFTRVGTNSNLNWTTVTGIRVTVQVTAQANFFAYNFQFIGGSLGQLNGVYNYIQVNVNNNGLYEALSPPSAPLVAVTPGQTSSSSNIDVTVINGAAQITPIAPLDAQVNEIWFYRIAATDVGLTSAGASANSSSLSQYYLVGKLTGGNIGGTFLDTQSDDQIIETNIVLNPFLLSLRFVDPNGVQDNIFCICGPVFTRMLYMGASYIYISDSLDPDAVDSRYTLKPSGDPNEKNLWLKVIANGSLILATTKDLYEITGSFTPLPSGIIDVTIIPIGDAFPPLSQDCCEAQSGVFYIASDGLRITTGQHSINVSPQLNFLFQGQTRHNVPPVNVVSGNAARYAITQGNNRIYFTIPLQDGSIRLITYDLIKSIYTLRYTDPLVLHTDPNGRVFAGYDTSSNPMIATGAIYELESNDSGGFYDSGGLQVGYSIYFVTVFDANGQPRNRKDTFTLKLIMDTGGDPVSVYIQKDGIGVNQDGAQTWTLLGNYSTTGLTTVYIPLNNITLGFRYALKIVDVSYVTIFKLYEMTIEYDPRPEQLDYMRIQPNNLGTISRKRFVNYAFVIDTLGNNITFTPYIDNSNAGIAPASSICQTPAKQTYIHYFTQEQLGTDISGILSGGVFEFYGLNTEEIISEKLPVPVKFLVIPANDYGQPNRKRHTSYKFQINTRGQNVQFTPIIDGVPYIAFTVNTPTKQTVECFFNSVQGDVKGIDIGGTLQSLTNSPFEFYGVIVPQTIEMLPNQLEYYVIPNNNYGVAARKRIRTMVIVIDTLGQSVIFTPIVDGVPQGITTTLVSNGKTTLYHFFENDVFGTDFGGTLSSEGSQFEFYELGQPESVETLPVPKVYDQLGPVRWDRIAKIFNIHIRLIMNGSTTIMPLIIYGDANPTNPTYAGTPYFTTSFIVVPGCDQVYEIQLPKSINTTMCRIVLGPTSDSFHRYDVQIRVSLSGMESDAQWIPLR